MIPLKAHKYIIHVDMDAFYASVEMIDNPSLKGKPVIVGGINNRGVVSAASYEARSYGVHSAMPIATAKRVCGCGIFLPVRMRRYQEISNRIFEIFNHYTPLVEPLSVDEAFLDVTASQKIFGSPITIARLIKTVIKKDLGLTASAGIGPSKFIAKIASDLDKPDGLISVTPGNERAFLEPLPIDKLWGVGKKTKQHLSLLNVKTIGDLRSLPCEILEGKFGKHGRHLHLLSEGIDDRAVEPARSIKSIGNEDTFENDILDPDILKRELLALSAKVAHRLRQDEVKCKTIILKVKYSDFVQVTRSETLDRFTDDGNQIYRSSCALLQKTEAGTRPVRLVGVTAVLPKKPAVSQQLTLFNTEGEAPHANNLNRAIDHINNKYGEHKIIPGSLLDRYESDN